jgi:hypothetical protein
VRDRDTFIPVLAVQLNPSCEADRYLLARAGFGRSSFEQAAYVLLARIAGGEGKATCDPYDWGGSRTLQVAHDFIIKNFAGMAPGEVVDVEYILGEKPVPKISEQHTEDQWV